MNTRTILGVVAVILALLLIGALWWGMKQSGQNKALNSENQKLTTEINDLEGLKVELQNEVDSLEIAYEYLSLENDSLSNSILNEEKKVRRRDATIRSMKSETNASQAELSNLRAEIKGLLAAKANLESSIQGLMAENDSLRIVTGELEGSLSRSKEENATLANLNRTMQGEIDGLTLANFKASAFQVELEKNKPKATAKSRKAKRILVSFDLTNVPQKYQGVRPIYLVITDDKATPIKLDNPIHAQVVVNGQSNDILAAEAKEVNIEENQRISFKHDLDNRLKKGYYRVIAYTDIGILGASNFRLR